MHLRDFDDSDDKKLIKDADFTSIMNASSIIIGISEMQRAARISVFEIYIIFWQRLYSLGSSGITEGILSS